MRRTERSALIPEIKLNIGRLVVEKIPSGSTLFLDAGSTLLGITTRLSGPMTVVTSSLDIVHHLSDKPEIALILLGGQWDMLQRLFSGAATLMLLKKYRTAILGACALYAKFGLRLTAGQEADAEIKRDMLAFSNEHWLVAGHMKLNRCEPYHVAPLS